VTAQAQLMAGRVREVAGTADARQRAMTLALLTLYPLLLIWIYREYVAPAYPNVAYEYHSPDHPWLVATAVIAAVLPALFLPARARRPGVVMLWLMYLLAYVPSQAMPVVRFDFAPSAFLRLQLVLLAGMAIMIAADRLPAIRLPRSPFPSWTFWAGFGAVYAFSMATIVRYVGMPATLPTFAEVYDVRYDFIDRVEGMPGYVSYLWAWQGQVFNPFLIAYGVARRTWLPAAVGALGQIYLYGSSGEKSQLFAIALIIGVYLLVTIGREVFGVLAAAGACLLMCVSIVLDVLIGTQWFMGLFIQRLTVTPGLLTGAYFDYFSDHVKAMLGYSVLGPIVDYPYGTTIPYIMGRAFFESPQTVANANIWADGFANFGFTGIVLASLIGGGVIWAFNALSRSERFVLAALLGATAAMVWTNISVFTSMVTHGIPLTLALLWAAPLRGRDAGKESAR
jgi:hypothetical protein